MRASESTFVRALFFACALAAALSAAAFVSCGVQTTPGESASDKDLAAGTATMPEDRALVLYAAGEVLASAPGADSGVGQPVAAGDYLAAAQSLSTGAESMCELQFGERAVVRIDENTRVSLGDLLLKPGATKVGIDLAAGSILCKVEKLAGSESFRVRSKAAVCGVRGTEFGVTVASDANTILAVKDGRVSFLPAGFDPDRLSGEVAGGDPALADGVRELAGAEQVVAADQESEMNVAAAAKVAEQVRALEADIKEYTVKKTLTPAEKERVKSRFQRFRDDWQREVEGPRPMQRLRRERLKALNDLRRRRIEVVPRKERAIPSALPQEEKPPVVIREEPRPPVPVVERSENLMRIQVTVEPRLAAIFLNGRPAGRGRFQGLFAVGESLAFDFKLPGYVSQSLYLDLYPEVARDYHFTLKREGPDRNNRPERPRSDRIGPDGGRTPPEESPAGGQLERKGPDRPMIAQERPSTRPIVGELVAGGTGNRLFAADATGTIFCLDARGRTIWKKPGADNVNLDWSPVEAGGKIYFAGSKTALIVNAADGNTIEETDAADFPGDRYNRLLFAGSGMVARPFDKGVDIIGVSGGETRRIELGPDIVLSLLLTKEYLFAADRGGAVRLFDLKTGRPLPRPIQTRVRDPLARGFYQPAASLYLAGADRIACVDPATRRLKLEKPIQGGRVKPGNLSVSAVGVYVFAAGRLFAFSHQGEPLFSPLEGVTAPPLAYQDKLAVGRPDAFEILDARTGKTFLRLPHKFKITARPVPAGDYIAAGTDSGEILVINPGAMKPAGE